MISEEALKTEAQKRRRIPEWLWTTLKDEHHLEDALLMDSLEEAVGFIVEEVDKHVDELGVRRGGSRGGSKRSDTVEVSLSALEVERKAALEKYLAMCGACDADVYVFRKKVLGRHLLPERAAHRLLKSPAAALLATRHFQEANIPIVGHTAEVNYYRRELVPQGTKHEASVAVHPPGITQKVSMITWSGTSLTDKRRPVVLEFPDEAGNVTGTEVWSTSLLGELRELGEKLSERYRWQPAQAVWFVLTGETPAVFVLQATRTFWSSMYHDDIVITIEASPWVSSETVGKAFRKAQIETMGTKGGRPPGEKNLRLFRFVTERIEPLGLLDEGTIRTGAPEHERETELVANQWYMKIPEHKYLEREWNEMYPEDSYEIGTGRFWRAYKRIRKTIAHGPPYQW